MNDTHVITALKLLMKLLVTPEIVAKHSVFGSKYSQKDHNIILYENNSMSDEKFIVINHNREKAIKSFAICIDHDVISFKGIVRAQIYSKSQNSFVLEGQEKVAVFSFSYNPSASVVRNSALSLHTFNNISAATHYYNRMNLGQPLQNMLFDVDLHDLKNIVATFERQQAAKKKRTSFPSNIAAPAAGGGKK